MDEISCIIDGIDSLERIALRLDIYLILTGTLLFVVANILGNFATNMCLRGRTQCFTIY